MSMKEASCPIFIAAPFIRPSVSTICSRGLEVALLERLRRIIRVAGEVPGARAGVAGALRADHRSDLGGAADAPLRNVQCRPRAARLRA